MRESQAGSFKLAGVKLLACIDDYKGTVSTESGGQKPAGFTLVPEKVQVIRAEILQESRFAVNNRLLITCDLKQASFRNHVTRRVLQSIIFSLSRFAVNGITFRVHVLQ